MRNVLALTLLVLPALAWSRGDLSALSTEQLVEARDSSNQTEVNEIILARAADNDSIAQFALGLYHYIGMYGLPKDRSLSYEYYEKSCQGGMRESCENLQSMFK